ncbi:MAG TPA: isopentenyl-diphosphate Delta-isomerase [Opitutaceae bacterium]|nr:isopentenyl-diphosphate Delta-isomerase [Opitutaceae bacterium]
MPPLSHPVPTSATTHLGTTQIGRSASLGNPSLPDVILVDSGDHEVGSSDKMTVHAQGLLHRAFSIFLVDRQGRILLQQRSFNKYHSGGLWANTCCGHPRPGEGTTKAALRRLHEELGVTSTLTLQFTSSYFTSFPNGLKENELVHIYFGAVLESAHPNPDEVNALAWMTLAELEQACARAPQDYTYWLRHYLNHHGAEMKAGIRHVLRSSV